MNADVCSSESHNRDKQSPATLAANYIAHDKPWHIGGETLALYTCRRCRSTVCVPVTS